jgi:hypothetical protein
MSDEDEDLRLFLARVEAAYRKRLPRAWQRDPESFPDYVRQLEAIIDLRRKMWPSES